MNVAANMGPKLWQTPDCLCNRITASMPSDIRYPIQDPECGAVGYKNIGIVWYKRQTTSPLRLACVKGHMLKNWLPRKSIKIDSIDGSRFTSKVGNTMKKAGLFSQLPIPLKTEVVVSSDQDFVLVRLCPEPICEVLKLIHRA